MTVATSIDSLLEKLKQEELYLPPKSLHSQSCQFLLPTRASPPSSSFASELSLVRLALNALQGVLLLLAYISSLMDYALSQLIGQPTKTHFMNFKLEVEGHGGAVK
ncbi:LOW QUALITY PROTEIN: hypothetical protein HID58_026075 [Brassica napus]|uniref:Uncharacterized protein n=2 Tax=Brassica napus TaxID=3708 RepID=A0ABQ8CPW0_BRANA|nr:LOW QUALITY PROTEIN: hypothetical protein HID58_026075 [Brassica napus]